jgi:outer membrane protein TolC
VSVLIGLAVLVLAGAAQEETDDPALQALVEEALRRNPEVQVAEAARDAARARPAQARAWPDPMLSLTYTNDGWSPSLGSREMTTLGLLWSQDLPLRGTRRLQEQIAEREVDRSEQQLERARLRVVSAVRRAYHGLLQARATADLVGEQREIWREIEGVARARYAVGQGAQQDVLRVQVEVTRVGQLEAEQAAEIEIRQAELNQLLDRPAGSAVPTTASLALRSASQPVEEVIARLTAASPELRAARAQVEADALAVDLALKQRQPELSLAAGYMNRGGLDPMWQAGIGVRLPLARSRRDAALAEAEARRRGAERRVQALGLQLRYRTQERLARLEATERMAVLYEKGIIPQDRMSVEAAVASYQAGKVPFVAVLEAMTTLYGDRATLVRLLGRHARTRADLEEASLEGGGVAMGDEP